MYKIKGKYDGHHFKFDKPLPKGHFNVELKFIKTDKHEDKIK